MSSKKTKNRSKTKSSFSVKSFFYKLTGQLKGKLSAEDMKKLIIMNLPYIFIFIIANRTSHLYQISPGETAGEKILYLMEHSNQVLGVIPSLQGKDLLIGIGVAAVAKILIWQKQQDSKKFRKGLEYGGNPDRKTINEINDIMNHTIDGWLAGPVNRLFGGEYGTHRACHLSCNSGP